MPALPFGVSRHLFGVGLMCQQQVELGVDEAMITLMTWKGNLLSSVMDGSSLQPGPAAAPSAPNEHSEI